MSILYKKNRALKRIMRNRFRAEAVTHPEPAAPQPAAAPAYTLSTDIPESYNDTYIRAIPKDPRSAFVYWEMPKDKAGDFGVTEAGKIHTDNNDAAKMEHDLRGTNNTDGQQHYDFSNQSWQWGNGNGTPAVWANCVRPQCDTNTNASVCQSHDHHIDNNHICTDNNNTADNHHHHVNNNTDNVHHGINDNYHTASGVSDLGGSELAGLIRNKNAGSTYVITQADAQNDTLQMPSSSILPHLSSGNLCGAAAGKSS